MAARGGRPPVRRVAEAALTAAALALVVAAADGAADLEREGLSPPQRMAMVEALARLGEKAAASTPSLIAVLHTHDDDKAYAIPYFCTVTRALARVAPRDPRAIRAVADALAKDAAVAGMCHRCGCALDALREAGPAAEPIAVPALEVLARRPRAVTTYPDQLGRTIEAIGAGGRMAPTLLRRAANADISPDDRAIVLRAVAKSYGELAPADQATLRETATLLLASNGHGHQLRVAAAEAFGRIDPPDLDAVSRALQDRHYEVRAAGARAAAQLGLSAFALRGLLIDALDPLLGTAEAAAGALVAIGPAAAADLEARTPSVRAALKPLFLAAAAAARAHDPKSFLGVLKRGHPRGPFDIGYVETDILSAGDGPAYDPRRDRIRVSFEGRVHGPGRSGPVRGKVTVDHPSSHFFHALEGRRAGDHLHMVMSPEVAQSPFYGVPDASRPHELEHFPPAGAALEFDVTIEKVCEPVIWTLFRGSGIFAPIRVELYCR